MPLHTFRMARFRNPEDTKCCQGCRATGTLITHGVWNIERQFGIFFYPRKSELMLTQNLVRMFTEVLFMSGKTWKQKKWPSFYKWNKLWYVHTMKYYLPVKKKNPPWNTRKHMEELGVCLAEWHKAAWEGRALQDSYNLITGNGEILVTAKRSMAMKGCWMEEGEGEAHKGFR